LLKQGTNAEAAKKATDKAFAELVNDALQFRGMDLNAKGCCESPEWRIERIANLIDVFNYARTDQSIDKHQYLYSGENDNLCSKIINEIMNQYGIEKAKEYLLKEVGYR
jgi:GTP cyclohydrolase I